MVIISASWGDCRHVDLLALHALAQRGMGCGPRVPVLTAFVQWSAYSPGFLPGAKKARIARAGGQVLEVSASSGAGGPQLLDLVTYKVGRSGVSEGARGEASAAALTVGEA